MSTNVLHSHHKIFEYLCDTKFNSTEELLSKYVESFSPVYENGDLNFKKIDMFDSYIKNTFINDLYKIIEIFSLGIDADKRQTVFPSIDNNWFLFDKFRFKNLTVEINIKRTDLYLYECCHLFNLIKQNELYGTGLVRITVCFAHGFTKFVNDLFIDNKLRSALIDEYSKKYLDFTFPDFSSKVPVFKNINPPTFANLMSLPSTLHDEPFDYRMFDYWNFFGNNFDKYEYDLSSVEELETRYIKKFEFDGRRSWEMGYVLFRGNPAFFFYANGRDGCDGYSIYKFDEYIIEKIVALLNEKYKNLPDWEFDEDKPVSLNDPAPTSQYGYDLLYNEFKPW